MVFKILQGLNFLLQAGIVHSDLKSENILVEIDTLQRTVKSVKIIDFGTSFQFTDINYKVDITTPEYLPPEVLDYVEIKNKGILSRGQNRTNIQNLLKPWSIDIWSLGVVILEVIIGFPVWMSYKGRTARAGRESSQRLTGIFGI